jgi:hypothetical protein
MRGFLNARSAPATVLGMIAVILAAGSGAYAATTSGGGTISACVRHDGGTLYRAHNCARHDQKLSWNASGPQGATGVTGTPGPRGATGITGTPGAQGVQGLTGGIGLTGTHGTNGTNGTNGATNVVVRTASASVGAGPGQLGDAQAKCNPGERATGGGEFVSPNSGSPDETIRFSAPSLQSSQFVQPANAGEVPDAWAVEVLNNASASRTLNAYVVCASP